MDLLDETGKIEVGAIVRRLVVSPATARRDLDFLAERRVLTRTHGGAMARSLAHDLPIRLTKTQLSAAEAGIARAASDLVPRGTVIGLSSGTTATAIAEALLSRSDIMKPAKDAGLTIVTNALNIAMLIVARSQLKAVVTGGVVDGGSLELVDPYGNALLRSITLDIAFIDVDSFVAVGDTSSDDMASRAAHVVVTAPSADICPRMVAGIGRPDVPTTIITDASVKSTQLEQFSDCGFEVIVA